MKNSKTAVVVVIPGSVNVLIRKVNSIELGAEAIVLADDTGKTIGVVPYSQTVYLEDVQEEKPKEKEKIAQPMHGTFEWALHQMSKEQKIKHIEMFTEDYLYMENGEIKMTLPPGVELASRLTLPVQWFATDKWFVESF